MEFPNLGEHCALLSCKQLDFLPFTCDACKQIYCKDHLKYEDHQCEKSYNKDRRVPVCPLCNQPISLSVSESADQKVNEHIENDCKSDLAQRKRSNKCNLKGCKQRELIPVLCAACKLNFCLRHRHENDHNCVAKSSSVRQAAINRYSSNKTNNVKPKSKIMQPKQSQQTCTNTIGIVSRQRNDGAHAQRNQLNSSSTIQPLNMSEDQALAAALQASLADSSQKEARQDRPLNEQESADAALAQSLAESEASEIERQLKESTTSKSSCLVS